MNPKGYDHPLHSLDLVHRGAQLQPDPSLAIPVPEGLLVCQGRLLRYAERTTTERCERAVREALVLHGQFPAFAVYGHTPAWAGSMRHWLGRLLELERARGVARLASQQQGRQRLALWREGLAFFSRARVVASLCGAGDRLLGGSSPRAYAALVDGLGALEVRLRDPELAARAARCGLGRAEQAQLRALLTALRDCRDETAGHEQAARRLSGQILVLRAALMGDLARLRRVAALVMPRGRTAELYLNRLLDGRGRLSAAAPR